MIVKIASFVARVAIVAAILGVCGYFGYDWYTDQPEPQRYESPPTPTHVDGVRLEPQDYQVVIRTQGEVDARTRSNLLPQVSGLVMEVAPNFRSGGFFEEGDLLVKIEDFDYRNELVQAKAQLEEARLRLDEEEARAEQAQRDWAKLGGGQEASPLVLREPQLVQARAAVDAAEARVNQAHKNLERTEIRAPYAGRIETESIDPGQYVSTGTVLANIYAVDYVEIRLPLADEQLAYVDLPELYRGEEPQAEDKPHPRVVLKARVGREEYRWEGRIVRTEGSIDRASRMLWAIAQVDDPYGRTVPGRPPLKVGQFVTAEIYGNVLEDVFVIPRTAIRQGQYVLVVNDNNELVRRRVGKVWETEQHIVIAEGLDEGEVLCVTLIVAAQGAQVIPDIEGEGVRLVESQRQQQRAGRGGGQGDWQGGGPPGAGGGDRGPSQADAQQRGEGPAQAQAGEDRSGGGESGPDARWRANGAEPGQSEPPARRPTRPEGSS